MGSSLGLVQLLHLIEEMPVYRRVMDGLTRLEGNLSVSVLDAAKPYFIAALYRSQRRPMLIVTSQPEDGRKLYEQLSTSSQLP